MSSPNAEPPPADEAASEPPSSAWLSFTEALAEVLAVLQEDQFLVVSLKRSRRFVQFAAEGAAGLRVEATSNAFLPRADRLTDADHERLADLGWHPPTGSPEEVTPDRDPDGSPNWFCDLDVPVPFADVARLAVATLVEVLGASHPGALEYEAFDADGREILLPTLGLAERPEVPPPAAPPGEDVERARELVLGVMRDATGSDDVDFDEDGDIAVRFGSAIAFVRVVEQPLFVRVYSPVLANVSCTVEVLERLNDLNTELRFARLVCLDDTVIAAVDLFAFPLMAEHIVHACAVLGTVADSVDDLLQAEFGGRTAFGEFRPRPRDRTNAGYL